MEQVPQSFEPTETKAPMKPAIVDQSAVSPAAKLGRPRAKRSDPDYEQVTAYIRRATYKRVKMMLLEEGSDQDFSELVETLLSEHLRTRVPSNSRT